MDTYKLTSITLCYFCDEHRTPRRMCVLRHSNCPACLAVVPSALSGESLSALVVVCWKPSGVVASLYAVQCFTVVRHGPYFCPKQCWPGRHWLCWWRCASYLLDSADWENRHHTVSTRHIVRLEYTVLCRYRPIAGISYIEGRSIRLGSPAAGNSWLYRHHLLEDVL